MIHTVHNVDSTLTKTDLTPMRVGFGESYIPILLSIPHFCLKTIGLLGDGWYLLVIARPR